MVEDALLNWGVLGIWTIYLLYEKQVILNKFHKSMERLSELIERKL